MSKINSFRIINLNYNNNTMRIDDEIFNLGGESTLFSLRNGGGKSVLVQMMIAPFVRKRYRDAKDRKFESYFTKTSPTYILTEWILDDNKTNVLIGMMVRKKSYSEEEYETDDQIEVVNFIHEYDVEDMYSIRNIPFVEIKDKNKSIKSFGNSKKLFEKLKKDKNINFSYYDMNAYNQSRNYFETLKQYKINNKEWESIIKEINKKESGLSDLFSDAKTVSGLVEKWFLKVVEDKLNENEGKSKVDNLQDIIKKYIYQYKENRYKLSQKQSIEKFKEETQGILELAKSFRNIKDNTSEIENKLAALIVYIEGLLKGEESQIQILDEKIYDLASEINDIEYEKLSFEIYKKEDELSRIESREQEINESIKNIEENIEKYTREKNIQECAEKREDYQEASQKTQEIEIKLKMKQEEDKNLAPKRENVGFSLKNYYLKKTEELNEKLNENDVELSKTKKDILDVKAKIDFTENELQKIMQNIGENKSKKNMFDLEEEQFNIKYKKEFKRNILGFYEENFVNEQNSKYDSDLYSLSKKIEKSIYEKNDIDEKIKKYEREKEELIKESSYLENKSSTLESKLDDMEKIISKRKDILKYIDSGEEYLFDGNYIASKLKNKIDLFDKSIEKISIKKSKKEQELKKITSGEMVELSDDIKEVFKKKDIYVGYGMQWLKKNNLSEEENLKIIKNNPLLPYSIILNREDLNKLKEEKLDIFTSYPIPIALRESLEEIVGDIENEILIINKLAFLVSFNKNLLDEEKLKAMILKLELNIEKINQEIQNTREDKKKYEGFSYYILENSITKKEYEILKKEIEDIKTQLKENGESLIELKDKLKNLSKNQEEIQKDISNLNIEKNALKNQWEDFKVFSNKYDAYVISVETLDELTIIKEEKISYKEAKINEKDELNQKLDLLEKEKRDTLDSLKATKDKNIKYEKYTKGEIIHKDVEDLEAEYETLTKEISETLKELEEQYDKVNKELSEKQNRLIDLQKHYNVVDKDLENVIFNGQTYFLLDKKIKELNENKKVKDKETYKIAEKKGKVKNSLEILNKKLKEKFLKEEPKPKDLVKDRDFDALIFERKNQTKKLEDIKSKSKSNIDKLDRELGNLSEFRDVECSKVFSFNLEIKDIKNYIAELKRDYKNSKDDEYTAYSDLNLEIDNVIMIDEFKENDFFKKSLEILKRISQNPRDVISNLNQTLEAHRVTLEKLSADIDIITKEKEKVVDLIYDYISEVHINIGKIDQNSTVNINSVPRKMLNIQTTNWDENREIYRLKTKNLLEVLTESCLNKLDKNENIEETISSNITTKNLYNEVVSIGSVDIKLYKIEENRQRIISWEQVCTNSGGEGFLSAFVVLSSLLTYMRNDEIYKFSQDSKVLIMDNPFAQTSAEHLLKPLMEIAKKSNTQLICLSGLKGESIYNRFDNIYVLDLVNSRLKNNVSILKGNHYKGEEIIKEIVSSRFEIKKEEVNQISLF